MRHLTSLITYEMRGNCKVLAGNQIQRNKILNIQLEEQVLKHMFSTFHPPNGLEVRMISLSITS